MILLITTSLFELFSADVHADYELSIAFLEDLYRKCRSPAQAKNALGCFRRRTDCRADQTTNDVTCHFNLYFRSFVASQNGNFAGKCMIEDFQDRDKWESCRLEQFDELYDFNEYAFRGDCSVQKLRYFRLLGDDIFCNHAATNNLRDNPIEKVEKCSYSGCEESETSSWIIVESLSYAKSQAIVNAVQTSVIMVLLAIATWLFKRDADSFVMNPLHKLADLVKVLSSAPLDPIKEFPDGDSETDLVERALKKFGRLLQIGFGEAGSEIIGGNLRTHGDLNPMIKGKKMRAIFGFAVIRNFTPCTECLQEDVMVFVNAIAHIVHKAVQNNLGTANKNMGEGFLLVWRLPPEPRDKKERMQNIVASGGADSSAAERSSSETRTADSALLSCVRVCIEVQSSVELAEISEHPKIQERLPGYRVQLGFGLHSGWAIEGAIGSTLKIDASYLSPNVNVASRLQSATSQFKVDILISEVFLQMLSPDVQALCRRIDRVTLKGASKPVSLYTYDVPFVDLNGSPWPDEEMEHEEFFRQFRPRLSAGFRRRFDAGVDEYLQGRWLEAKSMLDKCLHERPADGPSKVLRKVMEAHNYHAPEGWEGVRELENK